MANTSDSSLGVQQQCIPIYDGKDYDLWSFKMKTIFLSLDLWELVEKGYVEPDSPTTLTKAQWKKQQQKDASAFSKIQQGVSDSICRTIMKAATAKQAWDILEQQFLDNLKGADEREDKERNRRYLPLYRAADSGNWEAAEQFLHRHPEALTAIISGDGNTALHVAAQAGHVEIVQKLVNMMNPEDLAKQLSPYYNTALHLVCSGGTIEIAEILVEANPKLLSIAGRGARIPVVEAAFNGYKDMVHYLYSKTPEEALDPYTIDILLSYFINAEIYDTALDLVARAESFPDFEYPGAALALRALARKPSAFKSGSKLKFWQRWIYSSIWVQPPHASNNKYGDIESSDEDPTDRGKMITRVLGCCGISSKLFAKFPAIKHIYDEKLKHVHARKLLVWICENIMRHDPSLFERDDVYKAMVEATGNGIVEFINVIVKIYPKIIWKSDDDGRRIFNYAILHRQEKIVSLRYKMGPKRNILARKVDNDRNNLSHQAAILAPSSKLGRISGAALQMQSELQWFREVENILQPEIGKMVNSKNQTPRELFTEEHKKLVEEGEKWMKEMATSCTFAAALIAAIMFAAAFTVPGGYDDQTGIPIYLHDIYFLIFIISDALSLFSSTISVLTLLAIRTCIAIQRRRFPQVLALEVNSCPFHPIVLYIHNDDILRCYHCYCAS